GEALGLGHAVSIAEAHIGDQSFAVLLGDEFIDHGDALLPAMIDLQASTGGIVLAFLEVPWDEVSRYGVASVEPTDREDVVRVTGLVEKPARDEAPSNLIVIGRYILPRAIFDALKRIGPGSGGEIQLTDAMALMLAEGTPVHGIVFLGRLRPLPPLDLDLTQAYGNVLAEEVRAPGAVPAFDHAAVDGYAVRVDDVAGVQSGRRIRLNVVGDLSASSWRPVRLAPGTCFSVAAGAPLPAAADAVVPLA